MPELAPLPDRIDNMSITLNSMLSKEQGENTILKKALSLLEYIKKRYEDNKENHSYHEYDIKTILDCDTKTAFEVIKYLSVESDENVIFDNYYIHYGWSREQECNISQKDFEKSLSNENYIPIDLETEKKIEEFDPRRIAFHSFLKLKNEDIPYIELEW